MQIASRHKVYIIDTISLPDLAPLRDVLADISIKKVLHSADYDIRSLDRRSGLHIRNVFDTSIAAHFTGITRLSLEALTRDLLGVTINKSKQLQRADCSSLSLDPSLLWPLASLERLAKAPDTLSFELTSDSIRNWQRNVIASSLQACLSQC